MPKERWPDGVSAAAHCADSRAMELLSGAEPTASELDGLAEHFGYTQEDLRYEDLTRGLPILQENLRFLIGGLARGKKGELAKRVGVAAPTLTSWLGGKTPTLTNRAKIKAYFGLGDAIDLERDPLFLFPTPIREAEQRAWLLARIETLDRETLRELFPALRRLLKDP